MNQIVQPGNVPLLAADRTSRWTLLLWAVMFSDFGALIFVTKNDVGQNAGQNVGEKSWWLNLSEQFGSGEFVFL